MTSFRVATYNLQDGGKGRVSQLLAVMKATGADIFALTEADDPEVVAELADGLGMEHVWARGAWDRHLAVLSRFPILDHTIFNQPPITQGALQVRLDVEGQELTVFSLHLRPYPLAIYEFRRWQAVRGLLKVIAEQQLGPHLLAGDFNTVAPGDRYQKQHIGPGLRRLLWLQGGRFIRLAMPVLFKAGYVDSFRMLNPGDPGFSYRLWGHHIARFDYLIADPQLAPRLQRCWQEVDEAASDHDVLVAEFG
jgi:exodeoxyribonuclease-3